MALYALGDLHLNFRNPEKSMDRFGRIWKNHAEKARKNIRRIVKPEDTLVLTGDHSWGRSLEECSDDLAFIEALPGRKILLRGNHDKFWQANKTARLNEIFAGRLLFLQGNFYPYHDPESGRDFALVGTKGFTFEGPFYLNQRGEIIGWDLEKEAHAKKLVARECTRLKASFEAAKAAGYENFLMFLHYPPTNVLETDSPFTRMAEEYGALKVTYSHCHGEPRFGDSIRGDYHGITYSLVSGDYLDFTPERIL